MTTPTDPTQDLLGGVQWTPMLATVLAGVALGLSMAAACVSVEAVEVRRDANLNCYWGDILAFSGGISIYGDGADILQTDGAYALCRDDRLRCYISQTSTVAK